MAIEIFQRRRAWLAKSRQRAALWLSLPPLLTLLLYVPAFLGHDGYELLQWLPLAGLFSILASIDGVPTILRCRYAWWVKLLLAALHVGGAACLLVPILFLVLFVRGPINPG